jgi:hypothetical protein
MKQRNIVLALVIMLAVCVSVPAQITFSSWGRAVITPLAFSGEHSAVSAATSTWGDVPRIGFSANGTAPSSNIGFNLDFDFGWNINTSSVAIIGDNAKAWVKPLGLILPEKFNLLKLTAGFFKEDELRGKIGATEFASWMIPNGGKDEDNIFSRFNATAGAHFRLAPLMWLDSPWNGLSIQGAFGSNAIGAPGNSQRAILNLYNNEANYTDPNFNYDSWGQNDGNRNTSALDVYKAMQIALGYRIPDVGLVRFQFIGNNRNTFRWPALGNQANVIDEEKQLVTGMRSMSDSERRKNADVIEGAFLFDGIEGLWIDAGVKIPLEYDTKINFVIYERIFNGLSYPEINNGTNKEYTVQLPYVVALGVSWTPVFLSNLNIMARIDTSFGGIIESVEEGNKVENGNTFSLWLAPSYRIINNFTVGFDFGMDMHAEDSVVEHNVTAPKEQTEISEYLDFGFAPWIELMVGGGRVRFGVVVMLPGSPRYKAYQISAGSTQITKNNPKFKGDAVISFPISFTYSF